MSLRLDRNGTKETDTGVNLEGRDADDDSSLVEGDDEAVQMLIRAFDWKTMRR